jgi:hypothetical protein
MDSNEIEKKVSQSSGEVTELIAALRQLQARVEKHALVIQALKDIVLSQVASGEDEFLQRMERAAAQMADAKFCRKCKKAMSAKHNRCIYCGEERRGDLL